MFQKALETYELWKTVNEREREERSDKNTRKIFLQRKLILARDELFKRKIEEKENTEIQVRRFFLYCSIRVQSGVSRIILLLCIVSGNFVQRPILELMNRRFREAIDKWILLKNA